MNAERPEYQGTATIERADRWDILAGGVNRTEWRITFHGGHLDGRTSRTPTRKAARAKCEDLGYDWR